MRGFLLFRQKALFYTMLLGENSSNRTGLRWQSVTIGPTVRVEAGCSPHGGTTRIETELCKLRAMRNSNVLRFGQQTIQNQHHSRTRERLRIWLMFGAACAVLWCIRFLQRPETAERLDTIFNAIEKAEGQKETREGFEIVPAEEVVLSQSDDSTTSQAAVVGPADLSAIKDNTYFRSEENPVWFALWKNLRDGESADDTIDDVTYAQLLDQPDTYRGKLVAVRGTVMREELLDAPANEIGIDKYHRLIVKPEGGGNWPIIIYTLELPEKFPRGDAIRAEVSAPGYFFKNWSYAWRDGLGLAPVIMAKSVSWTPVVTSRKPTAKVSARTTATVIAVAAGLAVLVGYFAWRQSRHPPALPDREVEIYYPEVNEADS
jgi:hypothetical protein